MKLYIAPIILFLLLTACSSTNEVFNKNVTKDYSLLLENSIRNEANRLKSDDKITVSIWNHPDISIGSMYSVFNSNESFGKWVLIDSCGMVSLPKLGAIEIGGLTTSEAERFLESAYATYILNPIVDVKILNKEISILGQVKAPGNYIIDKEVNSIIGLISKAEGFTPHSNLKKVKLVRDGLTYELDFTDSDPRLLQINLLDGDVLFVPEKLSKKIDEKAPIMIPLSSLITAIAIVFTLTKTQ